MKTSPSKIAKTQRQTEALELRVKHYSYREIAKELNVSSATAYKLVKSAYKKDMEKNEETSHESRKFEIESIMSVLKSIMPMVEENDLGAIETYVKLMKHLSSLTGSQMPTKTELSGKDGAAIKTDQVLTIIVADEHEPDPTNPVE